MIITGIVMECNPFHDGHQYILDEARRRTGADYIVVVLSGDYVQRGIPAIFSKEFRTRKVLGAGADLVLELPLPYATGAANYFAAGAMSMLTSLGVVTDLAFGSLLADKEAIIRAAVCLDEEPPAFKALLQSGLAAGLSYPAARAGAAAGALGISLPTNGNDVLGIEYVRALNNCDPGHKIRIHAIPRIETDSATTWRTRLLAQQNQTNQSSTITLQNQTDHSRTITLQNQTDRSRTIALQDNASETSTARNTHSVKAVPGIQPDGTPESVPYCMSTDDLSGALYYRLQSLVGLFGCIDAEAAATTLMTYQDVDHDLACRMVRLLPDYTGWNDYTERLKTRNVTYTRVSRALLHILLNIRKDDVAALRTGGTTGYARILGLRRSDGPLLAAIRENACIPLIMSPRDGLRNNDIPLQFRQQLQRDLTASELYDHIVRTHGGQGNGSNRISELTKQMVIL